MQERVKVRGEKERGKRERERVYIKAIKKSQNIMK